MKSFIQYTYMKIKGESGNLPFTVCFGKTPYKYIKLGNYFGGNGYNGHLFARVDMLVHLNGLFESVLFIGKEYK